MTEPWAKRVAEFGKRHGCSDSTDLFLGVTSSLLLAGATLLLAITMVVGLWLWLGPLLFFVVTLISCGLGGAVTAFVRSVDAAWGEGN